MAALHLEAVAFIVIRSIYNALRYFNQLYFAPRAESAEFNANYYLCIFT